MRRKNDYSTLPLLIMYPTEKLNEKFRHLKLVISGEFAIIKELKSGVDIEESPK